MRTNVAKKLLREGKPAIGTWISTRSPLLAEVMGRVGFDWVLVDTEHGETTIDGLSVMLQAISATPTNPLVRLTANEPWLFKKALDLGAYGVVVPMVNTVEEARAAVRACRYPPLGNRGWGPTRGVMYGGPDYFEHANDELLLIVQTETRSASESIREILSVPGVDGCFIGPNDLSVSYGFSPGLRELPAEVEEGIHQILVGARDCGKFAGIHTFTLESLSRRIEEGFQFVAISGDLRFAQAGAQAALASVRRD